MRVGIDYLPAASHWPGSGRYTQARARAHQAGPPRQQLAMAAGRRTMSCLIRTYCFRRICPAMGMYTLGDTGSSRWL